VPESEEQRRNRELIELLNQLRVALPGLQVITAFLFQRAWAATFTALIALMFLVLWYGLPLSPVVADATRGSRRAR